MEGMENSFVMNSAPNNKPLSATEEVLEGEVSVQDWDLACATIEFGVNRAFGHMFRCPLVVHELQTLLWALIFIFYFLDFFKVAGSFCLKLYYLLRDGAKDLRLCFSRSNK